YAAVRVHANPQLPGKVQPTAAWRRAAGRKVLTPVLTAIVPRHPHTAFAIDGHRRMKLRRGLRRDGDRLAELFAVERAEKHIVVAGVIRVPGDPGYAALVERDG